MRVEKNELLIIHIKMTVSKRKPGSRLFSNKKAAVAHGLPLKDLLSL
jgi:hypothetical protein